MELDYSAVVKNALERFNYLAKQRVEMDAEMSRLRQFIRAAMHLLPENERDNFVIEAAEIFDQAPSNPTLTDAVRMVLTREPTHWLGVTAVRDRLRMMGFDFNAYTSNPLASISTTLRRLKEMGEAEKGADQQGTTLYRMKQPKPPAPITPVRRGALARELTRRQRDKE